MKIFGNSLGKSGRHSFRMEDQVSDNQQEFKQVPPKRALSPKKIQFQKKHSPQVTGSISTSTQQAILTGVGVAGGNFGSFSFSHMPAANKRILQVVFSSYTLTNYATTDFPAALYIACAPLTGFVSSSGTPTPIIGVLTPNGSAVPVYNAGGIIGYNMTYSLIDNQSQWDVSSINDLTFDISVNTSGTPIAYPLNQPMIIGLRIASAIV